jgi:hypothetical protein
VRNVQLLIDADHREWPEAYRVEPRSENQTRIVFIVLVLILILIIFFLIFIVIFIFIHCSIERMKIRIKMGSGQKRRLDREIKLICHCLVVCPPRFPSRLHLSVPSRAFWAGSHRAGRGPAYTAAQNAAEMDTRSA